MTELEYRLHLIHSVWWESAHTSDKELGVIWRYHDISRDCVALVSARDGIYYVAFRGTENSKNVWSHFNFWARNDVAGFDVHGGWLRNFTSLADPLERVLGDLPPKPMVFLGHSMGAALAGIAALHFCRSFKIERLFLLACPKFASRKGVRYLEENMEIESYMNGGDYIQNLVPFFHRPRTQRIGRSWFPPFSIEDHFPWDEDGNTGYVRALQEHFGEVFQSPWS